MAEKIEKAPALEVSPEEEIETSPSSVVDGISSEYGGSAIDGGMSNIGAPDTMTDKGWTPENVMYTVKKGQGLLEILIDAYKKKGRDKNVLKYIYEYRTQLFQIIYKKK